MARPFVFESTEILESTSCQVTKCGLLLSINGLQIHDVDHHINPAQSGARRTLNGAVVVVLLYRDRNRPHNGATTTA
jgi:hypothetical protein